MINYTLEENELTGDPKKYKAQVVNSRSYTFNDIANYLLQHNTGLSSAVIRGVWEGIKGAVEEYVSDGSSVRTELFHIRPSIRGVFESQNDCFDASRHKIRLNLYPGSLLRKIPEKLKAKKVNSGARSFIHSVTDISTSSVNDSLTPGKSIRITGSGLKITGDDPSCGIYFVPEKSSSTPIKAEISEVVVNNPSELIAIVPRLKKGKWNLRLITQYSRGHKYLKKPRNVNFDKNLIVA